MADREPQAPGPPQAEPAISRPTLALLAGVAIAALSLLLAGLAGGPYLDLSSLNLWLAVFAVAAFAALLAVPFAVERLFDARDPGRAEHWEQSMLVWGAVATAALLVAGLLIVGGGFDPGSSLADAAGLLLGIDAGLVVLTLLAWLLSG